MGEKYMWDATSLLVHVDLILMGLGFDIVVIDDDDYANTQMVVLKSDIARSKQPYRPCDKS